MGNPAEERPPPSVTSVSKLAPVIKPLARLVDLVIVPVAAQHAINIEVGDGVGV